MESNYNYPINIGNEENINNKLADLIKNIIKGCNFEYRNLPLDDPKRRKPCLNKAKKYLNWSPKVTLIKVYTKLLILIKNLNCKNWSRC